MKKYLTKHFQTIDEIFNHYKLTANNHSKQSMQIELDMLVIAGSVVCLDGKYKLCN